MMFSVLVGPPLAESRDPLASPAHAAGTLLAGSVPLSSVPQGSVPLSSMPQGSVPLSSVPLSEGF
jgi:hypothetical protein